MKKIVLLLLICAVGIGVWKYYAQKPSDRLFIEAVRSGNVWLVEKLLKKGANPNAYAYYNNENIGTALILAIFDMGRRSEFEYSEKSIADSEKIIDMLLEYGADPNLESGVWETAVMSAAEVKGERGIAVLDKLIKAGADINHRGKTGYNVLTTAVMARNPTMVRYLIKLGFNPNNSNFPTSPLLSYAAFFNEKEIVKELLAGGANVQAKDSQGRTALIIAKEKGYKDIIALLQKYNTK